MIWFMIMSNIKNEKVKTENKKWELKKELFKELVKEVVIEYKDVIERLKDV